MKVSKVKDRATQAMVDNGDVRDEDLIGSNGGDTAADLQIKTAVQCHYC